MDAALRALPSHGWSYGWTGRRDRALLVLSQMAGLSFQAIAELTVADIAITDGIATIRTPGGATTLRIAQDGRICGPCALARWLHALDLTSIYPNPGVVTAVLARAAALTADSPHLCASPTRVCQRTLSLPVLPSIDQWGPCAAAPQSDQVGVAGQPSGPDRDTEPVRLFARPIISRQPVTGMPDTQGSRTAPPPGTEPALAPRPVAVLTRHSGLTRELGQPRSDQPIPSQRAVAASIPLARRLDLARSSYSRADREATAVQTARLAEGLEGRARALLERRAE